MHLFLTLDMLLCRSISGR